MTVTTVDHAPSMPDAPTTVTASRLVSSAEHVTATESEHVRALERGEPSKPVPDLGASARYAALIYQITGWETFAYAALAASETTEEAEEHGRILRRRRPPWADED